MGRYGEGATPIAVMSTNFEEFMHYQYLPVRLPTGEVQDQEWVVLPPRLEFLRFLVLASISDALLHFPHLVDPYIYVTAKRGFASPSNPLNRPGWHCDDFGGTDINYIWCDAYPTRVLHSEQPLDISDDDTVSMLEFEDIAFAAPETLGLEIRELQPITLYRLDPFVIHATPEVPAPGGMRSFVKISISTHRYNLIGNSRNHLLDYDWPMVDRQVLRNQPNARANRDYA